MARGNTTAQNASSTAATQAGTDYGNADALYGPLSTTLENQVANAAGLEPSICDLKGNYILDSIAILD